ncbi:hypothetical protein TIFTF001_000946 [Ficus carica]|uniref:NADP-dependent oxidoreductase domain-containing protein n=1 Tax=Ficus carica TaxID=3494 RepID=A0AA88CL32_FICCA|nr:hypothetical protein TIFTF001_000946 [Ficus carica]
MAEEQIRIPRVKLGNQGFEISPEVRVGPGARGLSPVVVLGGGGCRCKLEGWVWVAPIWRGRVPSSGSGHKGGGGRRVAGYGRVGGGGSGSRRSGVGVSRRRGMGAEGEGVVASPGLGGLRGVGLGCADLVWGCPVAGVCVRQEGGGGRGLGPRGSGAGVWLVFAGGRERGVVSQVSKLGFGCMGLSGTYNAPLPEEDGISIIKYAFNKGITFYDTSDIYGHEHANEILVGKALKELPRDKIQLATKFGVVRISPDEITVKGTPEYVRFCCEASLKRLNVDYIDLYYQHRVDTTVPIEDTMGELKKLVEEGKVKYIGLSEANPDTIRRAHAVHPITAIQMEWSLWTREIEEEIIPLCR